MMINLNSLLTISPILKLVTTVTKCLASLSSSQLQKELRGAAYTVLSGSGCEHVMRLQYPWGAQRRGAASGQN